MQFQAEIINTGIDGFTDKLTVRDSAYIFVKLNMVPKLPIDLWVELKQVQGSFHSLDSFYFFLSLEHWSNFMSEKLVEKQGNGQNII